jgi:cytoskeletal protein RodZ
MAQKTKRASAAKSQERQAVLVDRLKRKEQMMKWAIIAAVVIILLLLLLLGYATDWTRGLHKDSATTSTPLSSSLDSAKANDSSTANTAGGNDGTNGTNGGNGSSTTERTTSNTSTTTNNTTNNNSTTPGSQAPAGLLSLYSDSSAGQNIQEVLDRADELGIEVNCTEDLFVQTCVFTQDGKTVTVKNLRLTGTVTSVLNDFNLNQ